VIVVSRCRNKRRRKRLPRVSLEALTAIGHTLAETKPASDPADLVEKLETRRAVWEALQRVSEGARDALILRYYERLPYAEIARILGCSSEAARSRVVHGKAQLQDLLTAPEESSAPETRAVRPAEVG
jgi:RNA polymerase sigma factor (sigma-70 family)